VPFILHVLQTPISMYLLIVFVIWSFCHLG
jgi:hypothetical protein